MPNQIEYLRQVAVTCHRSGELTVHIGPSKNLDKRWGRDSLDYIDVVHKCELEVSQDVQAKIDYILNLPDSDPVKRELVQFVCELVRFGFLRGLADASGLESHPYWPSGFVTYKDLLEMQEQFCR